MHKVANTEKLMDIKLVLYSLFISGIGIISLTYIIAYLSKFPWFLYWVGFFLCTVPVFIIVQNQEFTSKTKCCSLFLYGMVFYLIQYLGSGGYYNFRDEFLMGNITKAIYLNESLDIVSTVASNPIYLVLIKFPGMELLIVALQKITGITNSYPVSSLTIMMIHSTVLVLLYFIASKISGNTVVSGVAAFVYSANIDYSWVNTIYHYESISLILFFVAIYLTISRSMENSSRNYISYSILFVLVTSSITITHHLSTYALFSILVTFIIIHSLAGFYATGFKSLMPINYVLLLFGFAGFWLVYSASDVVGYYQNNILQAIRQVLEASYISSVETNIISVPSWGKGLPSWELFIYKFLYVPSLIAIFIIGLYSFNKLAKREKSKWSNKIVFQYCMVAISFLAFISILFSATNSAKASEVMRRLLPFFFIGTSFTIAYSIKGRFTFKQFLIMSLLCVVIFGGTGIGTSRVRGVNSHEPKYYYADPMKNPDIVAANNWINIYSPYSFSTDLLTELILDIKQQKGESMLTWDKVNSKQILLIEKIKYDNWEPFRVVALREGDKSFMPGDPAISQFVDNFKMNNIALLSYNNGSGKLYIKW
ncbi:MAG: hypothetical protein ACOY46_15650 [Bacillota bacterium]